MNNKDFAICENAIEIATLSIERLQELLPDMSRQNIIQTYIYEWANECETLLEEFDGEDYYEFVDNFTESKLKELENSLE